MLRYDEKYRLDGTYKELTVGEGRKEEQKDEEGKEARESKLATHKYSL